MAGYSGTPLAKKLGIKNGSKVFLSNPPENYMQLVVPLPDRVEFSPQLNPGIDIVHIFSTEKILLMNDLQTSLKLLKQDGIIWVSWPKKTSKMPTDITEDTIREIALPMGLVDIKVCAIDEVWSGLKLVIRKVNRK